MGADRGAQFPDGVLLADLHRRPAGAVGFREAVRQAARPPGMKEKRKDMAKMQFLFIALEWTRGKDNAEDGTTSQASPLRPFHTSCAFAFPNTLLLFRFLGGL